MMGKVSFRDQVLHAREEAILASVNRLLAEKGFDAMTVDAAAMIRVLDLALAQLEMLHSNSTAAPLDQLKAVARWTMQVQLAGAMPSLPAQNSALRAALMADAVYIDRLMQVSEQLGTWITAAQASGALSAALPSEVVLYTLFARACDPVLGLLKAGGNYRDEQIIEMLLSTCFEGLTGRT
jgi:TetR/AcrR family transcriptional regulator, regulator of autoinduction and epiphytic fitness